MYEEQPLAPASPRPFSEVPGLWTKLFQMTEEFFAQEAPRTSASNTVISVVILAVVSAIFTALSTLIGGGVQTAFVPAEYRDMAALGTGQSVVCSLCGGVVGTLIAFYLANGLVYLGARVLGGTGDFGAQAYLYSLAAVPIGMVTSVLTLLYAIPVAGPCLGGLIGLAASVYGIILYVRAVKVVHNLTTGKAVAAILVPVLIIAAIVACLVVVGLVALGPVIGDVFENIITELQ